MSRTGASNASTPARAASVFVAIESLTQRTPSRSRTSSRRCGTPRNSRRRLGDRVVRDADGTRGGRRRGGVRAVVAARQPRLRRQRIVRGELDAFQPESARHDPVARALEDPQLRGPVALERAVAVEMVRLEIQQHGDLERELVHVLELERRQLADDPCVLGRLDRAQRPADVSGDDDLAAGGAEDLAEQLGRRRLALRAGDADERTRREQAPAELDLRPDRDAASSRLDDERPLARHARVLDDELDAVEQPQIVLVAELARRLARPRRRAPRARRRRRRPTAPARRRAPSPAEVQVIAVEEREADRAEDPVRRSRSAP